MMQSICCEYFFFSDIVINAVMTYYIIMKKKYLFWIACILLFPAALILNSLSHNNPDFTERYYTMGIYRFFSVLFSNIYGIFPFSFVEAAVMLLLIIGLFMLVRLIFIKKKKPAKKKKKKISKLPEFLLFTAAAASFLYFLFILSWGLNYNRFTAFEVFGLSRQEVTEDMLFEIGYELLDMLNGLAPDIDDVDLSVDKVIKRGNIGYYRLQDEYPELGGSYSQAKPVAMSLIMSWFQIWGMYSPYTFEANINTMIPKAMLPSTIAHELAHKRGFAREDEANFIAFLTCINHNDAAYQYSGYLLAFINIRNALARTNRDKAALITAALDQKVIGHLDEITRFNQKYKGVLDELSGKINDMFLKSNRQPDGVLSYGRMVDLIAAYRYSP